MKARIKPWMLAYTIIFGLMSISFVHNDFENEYPLVVKTASCVCYILVFIGNLLYSLNRIPSSLWTPWKVVFPFLVLHFLFSFYYDGQHGKHAQDQGVVGTIVALAICLLLFFPTFRAHYLIGYGKRPHFKAA